MLRKRKMSMIKEIRLYRKATKLKKGLNLKKAWNFNKISRSFLKTNPLSLNSRVKVGNKYGLKRNTIFHTHYSFAWTRRGPYPHQRFRKLAKRRLLKLRLKSKKKMRMPLKRLSKSLHKRILKRQQRTWRFLVIKFLLRPRWRTRRLRYTGLLGRINGWKWPKKWVSSYFYSKKWRRHVLEWTPVPARAPHILRFEFKLYKHAYILSHLPLRSVVFKISEGPKTKIRPYRRSSLRPRLKRNAFYYVMMSRRWNKYLKLHLPIKKSRFYRRDYYKRSAILSNILQPVHLYYTLFQSTFYDLFRLTKKGELYEDYSDMKFYFTFKTKRFYINLSTKEGVSCLSIAPGMFLKFLSRRKSYKKNRVLCLLMAQYIRKILVLIKLKYFDVVIRRSPYMLNEIFSGIFRPLVHKFKDPLTGEVINENKEVAFFFYLRFLVFEHNKPYGYMKQKLKGRLKRKVWRKITRQNKIVD